MKMKTIEVADFLGSGILAGRSAGLGLGEHLQAVVHGGVDIVGLDFRDVELMTSSFLVATLERFWKLDVDTESWCAVLFLDADDEVDQEIGLALRAANRPGLAGRAQGSAIKITAKNLDVEAQKTFDLVSRHGETTAPVLARLDSDMRIQPNAWSNRLYSLYRERMIARVKDGRLYRYQSIEGLLNG